MPQPPAYNRTKDFTENFGSETDHTSINAELDAVSNSINTARVNLALMQADDGKIKADAITIDSLSQTVMDQIINEASQGVVTYTNQANASAAEALTSQNAAAASQTAAATSATNASTSATAAASSASAASTSATNAATSASTASTHATTATTKAGEAAASATTATTKASEAATSATTASGHATTATTKAGEAVTSATNAANSASAAATSAANAGNSATAAASSASAAATFDPALFVPKAGAVTIADVKTFSSPIVGSITGNAATATSATTADKLSTASGSTPCYAARAWLNFSGNGTVTMTGSGNVSSVTDNGVGDYTANFVTGMPDTNYTVTHAFDADSDAHSNFSSSTAASRQLSYIKSQKTTASFRCYTGYNLSSGASARVDFREVSLAFFR